MGFSASTSPTSAYNTSEPNQPSQQSRSYVHTRIHIRINMSKSMPLYVSIILVRILYICIHGCSMQRDAILVCFPMFSQGLC